MIEIGKEKNMKIKTVRGTNDYLPYEMRIRDYLQKKILETYTKCGFERIATPIMGINSLSLPFCGRSARKALSI